MLPKPPSFWLTLTWRPFLTMHDGKTYMAEVITLNFMQTVVMQIHVKYTHEHIKLRMLNCNILIWKWFVNIYEYVELTLWSNFWWVIFFSFHTICCSSYFLWSVKCFGQSCIHTNSCLESTTKWGLRSLIKHAVTIPYCRSMLLCSQRCWEPIFQRNKRSRKCYSHKVSPSSDSEVGEKWSERNI